MQHQSDELDWKTKMTTPATDRFRKGRFLLVVGVSAAITAPKYHLPARHYL